jgi:hypothetical protein
VLHNRAGFCYACVGMAIAEIIEREQHVVVDHINPHDKPGVGHHLFCVPFVAQAQCWPSRAVGVCMLPGSPVSFRRTLTSLLLLVSGQLAHTFVFFLFTSPKWFTASRKNKAGCKISIRIVHLYRGCQVKKQLEFWINFAWHQLGCRPNRVLGSGFSRSLKKFHLVFNLKPY